MHFAVEGEQAIANGLDWSGSMKREHWVSGAKAMENIEILLSRFIVPHL